MPKRKREDVDHDGPRPRSSKSQTSSAQEYFTSSLKLLHRALKTSKGFSRQKLGKRLSAAKAKNSLAECERINREIAALKDLDLDQVGESHLKKTLGKIKDFRENEGLKDVLGGEIWRPEGDEEMVTATRNVISGMCNMKAVKEVVEGTVSGMYGVFGIKKSGNGKEVQKKRGDQGASLNGKINAVAISEADEDDADTEESVRDEEEDLPWEGFSDEQPNGTNEAEESSDDEQSEGDVEYQSLQEDELDRFESLLGDPSDEEASSEEDIWSKIRASIAKDPKSSIAQSPSISISLSPEPPEQDPPSDFSQSSDSEQDLTSQPPPTKTKKPKQPPPTRAKASTFLPTLMGGYWSGTDSSASDLEEDSKSRPAIRKNRPGQAARRAIWEKKYKDKANHITSGQGSLAEQREAVLEARGVKRSGRGRDGGKRGGGRGGLSGGNAVSVGLRKSVNGNASGKREEKKRDDSGPLHPSWQAAKKAKTLEKTAKFEGKKVVF